jgi:hypothetical protein
MITENQASLPPQNLTIKQFGELFGPRTTKTYELLKTGQLRAVKIGKLTFIPYAEAQRWASSLPSYTEV